MATMQTAKQAIDSLASKSLSGQIATGTKQRLQSGDLAGAYKYQTDWANYLKSTGGKTQKPKPDMFREQAAADRLIFGR